MDLETRFKQLAEELTPTKEQHARVRKVLQRRIEGPAFLAEAKKESAPDAEQKYALWQQIDQQIASPGIATVFDRIRSALHPTSDIQSTLKLSILERLLPSTPVSFAERFYKWGAAFVIFALVLRASPFLFLAPQSSADSSVLLSPSAAGVELSSHGLWQPVTKELELHEAVSLRTSDGEATIMLHDDGNIRLAPHTQIRLEDVSDQVASVTTTNTLSIASGTVWLQALLPDQLRGFVMSTPEGDVTVHGGSVFVQVTDQSVHIEAWDRHVAVTHAGHTVSLVAGEYVDLIPGAGVVVQTLSSDAYKQEWVAQNLQRDAVHQREMAQLQQERRAAEAGILPSSPFYSVKRVAENVDVLLTLDPEARIQKRLQQASTRLNEAAAMIVQGQSGSNIPLGEYRQTLMDVAAGSGDILTHQLVQLAVAENAAQLSAALPDDQLYVLKRAVLEASATLPDNAVDQRDVSGTLLVDMLSSLQQAIQSNDADQVDRSLLALAPYLPALQSGSGDLLKPDVRKEALSLLSGVANGLHDVNTTGTGSGLSDDIARQIAGYLPEVTPPSNEPVISIITAPVVVPLTEEELEAAVQGTMHRVFDVYSMPQSRENALRVEMKKFIGNPDEGRYLRRLYHVLPENISLRQLVRHAIQQLRGQQIQIETEDMGTGSGDVQN
jgi:hypothetical protein